MAILGKKMICMRFFCLSLFFISSFAYAQEKIGVASLVNNDVQGIVDNNIRIKNVRDKVFFNETIRTGPNSNTQMIFLDETVIDIGPESELIIDTMVYDPSTGSGKFTVNAAVGVFSFVSGHLKKENYTITTPVAVIGIRGTTFDIIVEPTGETAVIVIDGEVEIRSIESGASVTVPKGKSSVVTSSTSTPTKPAPPSSILIERARTISIGSIVDTTPAVEVDAFEDSFPSPVDPQTVSESVDELTTDSTGDPATCAGRVC